LPNATPERLFAAMRRMAHLTVGDSPAGEGLIRLPAHGDDSLDGEDLQELE
jgi:hypothetical protein